MTGMVMNLIGNLVLVLGNLAASALVRPTILKLQTLLAGLGIPNWSGLGFPACPWARPLEKMMIYRVRNSCVKVTTCVEFIQLFVLWCPFTDLGCLTVELAGFQGCTTPDVHSGHRYVYCYWQQLHKECWPGWSMDLCIPSESPPEPHSLRPCAGARHQRPSGTVRAADQVELEHVGLAKRWTDRAEREAVDKLNNRRAVRIRRVMGE